MFWFKAREMFSLEDVHELPSFWSYAAIWDSAD